MRVLRRPVGRGFVVLLDGRGAGGSEASACVTFPTDMFPDEEPYRREEGYTSEGTADNNAGSGAAGKIVIVCVAGCGRNNSMRTGRN